MAPPLILIIEDEASMRKFVGGSLRRHGYQVLQASAGREGLGLARSHNPDLLLLDLGLPDMDGLEVLKDFRAWSQAPVVVVSARIREYQKVEALDLGADDYLTKPFGLGELLARIRVVLRRIIQQGMPQPVVTAGDIRIDLETRSITRCGEEVRLTPLEYRLLAALVRRNGKVVTHQQLLREVWGPGQGEQTQYLHIYMGQLRKKLEQDPTRPRHFRTETGVGYRLDVDGE